MMADYAAGSHKTTMGALAKSAFRPASSLPLKVTKITGPKLTLTHPYGGTKEYEAHVSRVRKFKMSTDPVLQAIDRAYFEKARNIKVVTPQGPQELFSEEPHLTEAKQIQWWG